MGELLLQEGDSSIVTAREILMSNGTRYAVSGDMYVDSVVDVIGQDNIGNIVGGAAVGAGVSALIQTLLGGSVGVEYTVLGAVVGGLVGSSIPNDRTVIVVGAGTQTEGVLTAR